MGVCDLISLLRRTVPDVLRKRPLPCPAAAWIDAPLIVMATYKKAQSDGTSPLIAQSMAKIASYARGLGVQEVNIVFDGPTRPAKIATVASRVITSTAFSARCPPTYTNLLAKDLEQTQHIVNGVRGLHTCVKTPCVYDFPTYSSVLKTAKFISSSYGTVHHARHDAEEYIALKMQGADIAITVDSDALAFGCTRIVQHLGKPEETWIELAEVLSSLNVTQDEFRRLCVFLGNDFNPRIRGVGPVACLAAIREELSIEQFAAKHSATLAWTEQAREAHAIFSLDYA